MKHARALAAGLILLFVATGGAWVWLGIGGDEPAGNGPATSTAPSGTPALPADAPQRRADPGPVDERAAGGPRRQEPARLHGRIVDALARPLPGCRIRADQVRDAHEPRPSPGTVTALSDAQGGFEMRVNSLGPLVVWVEHAEYPLQVVATGIEVAGNQSRWLGDIALHSSPGLVLQVRSATGAVQGALIEARPALADGELPGSALAAMVRHGETDARGETTLYGLSPQLYRIEIRATGLAATEIEHLHAVAAPQTPRLTVTLLPSRVLRGRVRGPEGEAVADALVIASAPSLRDQVARTDRNGEFRLAGLGAGPITLAADSERYGALPPVPLDPQAAAMPVELQFAAAADLAGQVVDLGSGTPLAQAEVWLAARVRSDGSQLELSDRPVRTDREGRFQLRPKAAGRYLLGASAPGYAKTMVHADGTGPDSVRIALARASQVLGRVVDANGRPLQGLLVRDRPAEADGSSAASFLFDAHPSQASQATGQDGAFRLEGLAAGTVRLVIEREGRPLWRTAVFTLGSGESRDLGAIRIHATGHVRGVAQHADGSPAAGATVRVEPQDGPQPLAEAHGRNAERTVTAADGSFALGPLGAGDYDMFYHYPAHETPAAAADTAARTRQKIRVVPGVEVVQNLRRPPP